MLDDYDNMHTPNSDNNIPNGELGASNRYRIPFAVVAAVLAFYIINLLSSAGAELYTSVSDLSKITDKHDSIASLLDDHIKLEEERLRRLRLLKQNYQTDLSNIKSETANQITQTGNNQKSSLNNPRLVENPTVTHPVNVFLSVKRLTKGIDQIYQVLVDEATINSQLTQARIEQFKRNNSLPNEDDYHGASDAIFRLQTCYKLDIHHLAQGRLVGKYYGLLGLSTYKKYTDKIGAQLNFEDCYSLGHLAYSREEYVSAVAWFEESLNLFRSDRRKNDPSSSSKHDRTSPINNIDQNENFELTEIHILEYLAFSAFKKGQTKYAYQITLQWLALDPDDSKAKGNIDYYLSMLDAENSNYTSGSASLIGDDGSSTVPKDKVTSRTSFGSAGHLDLTSEDEITNALCRGENIYPKSLMIQNRQCYTMPAHKQLKNVNLLSYNTEIIYNSPEIMRIHNFLTDEESYYLRAISGPKLERSTIHTSDGQHTSNFRIAKTAWPEAKNPVVRRIEKRISDILNLRLEEAENLQVVNYGLGGYYAAHFDFARTGPSHQRIDSTISGLARNDRLVTFLIYISDVEAGGATVFPQLGITVEPIKNSAIVWYNIHRNGLGDRRTKHSGCPVLYGSKWIATKWLREDANTFTRPCSLNRSD